MYRPNLQSAALPVPEIIVIALLGWGCKPPILDPVGHGWHVNVNKMNSAQQCIIAGLECIDVCTCGGQCENQREISVVENDAEVGDFLL